jgi:hypothetical protein
MTPLSISRHRGGSLDGSIASRGMRATPARSTASSRSSDVSNLASFVVFGLAVVAVGLRALELSVNRSLSQDEAMLALNVTDRSMGGLFHRLDFLQGAPIGFLALQKLSVEALGDHEYSLRLVAFIAGTAAVFLFIAVAKRFLTHQWAWVTAVAVFAVSDPLIRWTGWAKPYAVDVFFTLLLLWLGARLVARPHRSDLLAFAGVSLAAVWFSFAAIFVLAGVSGSLTVAALIRRQTRDAGLIALASTPWLLGFLIFISTAFSNLRGFHEFSCIGCPETGLSGSTASASEFAKLRGNLGEFRYVTGIPHFLSRGGIDLGLLLFLIALAISVVGTWSIARRQAELAAMLVAPLGFMLIAWGLGQYPVLGRTQLFLAPLFLLAFSEGVAFMWTRSDSIAARAVALTAGGAVIAATAVSGLGNVGDRQIEDIKPVLAYIASHQRAGESVYVYYTTQYQLRYYMECHCAGRAFEAADRRGMWPERRGSGGRGEFAPALLSVPPKIIVPAFRGRDPRPYAPGLRHALKMGRVWFLLGSLEDQRRRFILDQLDARGRRLNTFRVGSGKAADAAYLYDGGGA